MTSLRKLRKVTRPPLVTLECPRCSATKQVPRMHRDPPMTARVDGREICRGR